jgi:FAD/FMN-containing dehydrogenase
MRERVRVEPVGSALDTAAVAELRSRFAGELVLPEDDGYDEARAVWNGVIDKRPALIARVSEVDDVVEALAFARQNGLRVSVRGGGHNVAGTSVREGGLVVDLSRVKEVEVDADGGTVRAGAGCTLGELDVATQAFGLATPLGVVSETGIAGLTLGGGIGWLRRRHGLSSDNLVSLELVTAGGEVVTASESENPDLYWALRGGGGGFVVVTSFEYRLHAVGPEVMVCFVLYPAARATEVLRFADEHVAASGDDLSPLGVLGQVPQVDAFPEDTHGVPYVAILALHPGAVEEGAAALAPLRELGDPLADLSGPMPYVEAQKLLDEDYPDGWRYYWTSVALDELGTETIERIAAHAAAAPSHHSTVDVWYHGGAMGRVGAAATAFGPRPQYLVGIEANWDAGDDDANIVWARQAVADLGRFSSGGSYLNFPGFFEEGAELLRSSYGERNYQRLQEVRRRFDPDDVFARPE